jgi:hypothetical protein
MRAKHGSPFAAALRRTPTGAERSGAARCVWRSKLHIVSTDFDGCLCYARRAELHSRLMFVKRQSYGEGSGSVASCKGKLADGGRPILSQVGGNRLTVMRMIRSGMVSLLL